MSFWEWVYLILAGVASTLLVKTCPHRRFLRGRSYDRLSAAERMRWN